MKWKEITASKCRYGKIAGRLFRDAEIIWEHSENSYQGYADVLAFLPDGRFLHLEWTYGSCSGCDEWEARDLSDDEIEQEMRNAGAFFSSIDTIRKYLHLDPETIKGMLYPTPNSPVNASIPGMLRYLGNERMTDFDAMAIAFDVWEKSMSGREESQP